MIYNNFCLKNFFVHSIFKALFAKKTNCAIRAEAKPVRLSKQYYAKSCVLIFVTTFVWKSILYNVFQGTFCQKTELCIQGRGQIHGAISLICNPSRDFYYIWSNTKFGWASSIIFWSYRVHRQTHRQTDTHTQTDTQTTCQKWLFWTQ